MPEINEVPEYKRESLLKDMHIPSVRERDPDPQAGPRLNVKEFRLQGIVEFPELGITLESLRKEIESIRFDLMEEGDKTESGFSHSELAKMSQLVVDIEKNTPVQHVGPLEVQQFVFLIRDMMRKRGATLGMIETVADAITNKYREKGFILAKAFIPKQEVRDGVVTLTLLLGELGDVIVEDNARTRESLVQGIFKPLMYKPVTNDRIDEAIYLVNDVPGVQAAGFFSPGKQVGDTELTIKVLEEDVLSYNLRVDNHGSESTSENRVYADMYWHNPSGMGDELYLSVLNSYDPDNSTYGSFRYSTFLGHARWRGSLGFSSNDFVSRNLNSSLTGGGDDRGDTVENFQLFTGESQVANASVKYMLSRSRTKNYSLEARFSDINSEIVAGSEPRTQEAQQASLLLNFDVMNETKRQLYFGNIALNHTEATSGSRIFEDTVQQYEYLSFDISRLSFHTIPLLDKNTRLLLKVSGQYAGESISNISQMSLAGPTRARGFSVNGFQADDGVYIGADWIIPLPRFWDVRFAGEPLNKIIQPFLLADISYGVIHPLELSALAGGGGNAQPTIEGSLGNVGIGLRINHGSFSANIMATRVERDEVKALQERTPRRGVTFDLQFAF